MKKILSVAMLSAIALSALGNDQEVASPESYQPVNATTSSTRIVADSDPMNHEIVALTKLQEEHSKADAVREEQYRYTLARQAGQYFEPRIMDAVQASQPTATEAAVSTAAAETKSETAEGKNDKREASGLGYGVKAGLNITQFADNYEGAPAQYGFTAGAYVDYIFKNDVGLAVELVYSSQKAQTEEKTNEYTGENSQATLVKLNYINIPFILKKENFIAKGLAIETGLQLGFMTSGTITSQYSAFTLDNDLTSDFKTLDLGIPFGLNYTFKFGLTLGARYTLGLMSIVEQTKSYHSKDYKNRVGSFTVGYRF